MLGSMDRARVVIHASALAHQVRWANALQAGLAAHGIAAQISHSPDTEADMHIVQGPWFALNRWRHHPRTLYLDRAHWGDPDCVSLHWLRDGEKRRTEGNPYRTHPVPRPWKSGRRLLVLCDYGHDGTQELHRCRPLFDEITVRRHPAEGGGGELAENLAAHDIAIGRRSTALIDAALAGLPVISCDPHSPVAPIAGRVQDIRTPDREPWLRDLAWHNWHIDEVTRGDAWQFLRSA